MAFKSYKPTTPGQRGLVLIDRSELWKGRPVKSLLRFDKIGRSGTIPDVSPRVVVAEAQSVSIVS